MTSLPWATDALERRDAVDIDEMRGLGEPESHGRHQALAARKHAAVLRGNFGKQGDRLVDVFGA